MEALLAFLMFMSFLFGSDEVKESFKNPCHEPFICREGITQEECLKEALNYQMKYCLEREIK